MSANIYNFILNIWVEKSESQSYLKPFTQKSKHKAKRSHWSVQEENIRTPGQLEVGNASK